MGSASLPLRSSGIYHNLPTFDPSLKDLTAIVTGANGISGFHTCRALLDSPQRWSKIYAMSRRPPPEGMMNLLTPEQRSKIQHVASDFLKSPEELADAMRKAGVEKVDYIFFYSYLQPKPPPNSPPWSNAQELCTVNTALLSNFLSALPLLPLHPRRILLQTGAKNYGLHLGRTRSPCIESDPQPTHLEPNFYYPQEKLLFEYCATHPETGWNVIMPAWIIGATANAQMNALHPFAVYAAVRAHRGQKLVFPGDWRGWETYAFHSSARLTGYLSEWAVLEEGCRDQRFNSQDTSPVTWDRFFERFGKWFGVEGGVEAPAEDDLAGLGGKVLEIVGNEGGKTPMGYGPPTKVRMAFTLSSWAGEEGNREAWREMMKESGGRLTHDPFEDIEGHFTFGDLAAMGLGGCMGMNKARRLGWTGFVDTVESVFEMYWEMGGNGEKGIGMVPAMKVTEAEPLV